MQLGALADDALALDPFARAPLVLGYSGGGDSTALLLALAEAAGRTGRPLHALVFDHALRPESAEEAQRAARIANSVGAQAHVARWETAKRNLAKARAARHRWLALTAAALGAKVLHLGHTIDDRIETLAMRAARPGGWRGMTAMGKADPSPAWPEGAGLAVSRPLLEARRAGLRALLKRLDVSWIDDPGNEDVRQERIRIRRRLLHPEAGAGQALLQAGDRARRLDRAVSLIAAPVLQSAVMLAWGGVRLDVRALAKLPAPAADRAVERAALAASGALALNRKARVRLLQALLAGETTSSGGVMTLPGGLLTRDPGAAAGRADGAPGLAPLRLAAGEAGVFDGRFRITARDSPAVAAAHGSRLREGGAEAVPAAARPGLVEVREGGARRIAGLEPSPAEFLGALRLAHLGLCEPGGAWFDEVMCCVRRAHRTGAAPPARQYC